MKIGFVPLDDRPCTRDFAAAVARIAGEDLMMPPAPLLGHFLTPGSPEGIIDWLKEVGPELDVLVASIDMLAYGGLIASRSPEPEHSVARERVAALSRIKNTRPDMRILAFNVLMRISITCSDAASARHWDMVHRLSILEDRASLGLCSPTELAEKDRLLTAVPAEVLGRYKRARTRNHAVNLFCLDLVSAGVIDFLSFCQEDAHLFGPHRAEQGDLRGRVRALGLAPDRVTIYAGTDEAGMLLVARAINERLGLVPRFRFLYTPPGGGRNVAVFEDRPVEENIRLQVSVARGEVAPPCEPLRELDCFCLVNCPRSSGPEDWGDDPATAATATGAQPGPMPDGHDGTMKTGPGGRPRIADCPPLPDGGLPPADVASNPLGQLQDAIHAGVPAGVLDIARPNGADPAFMADLLHQVDVARLAAYAAWNTAGNSAGTVVATLAATHAALKSGALKPSDSGTSGCGDPGASAGSLDVLCQFLFERFVDDWLYQSVVRSEVNSHFASVPGVNLHNLQKLRHYEEVDNMVRERLGGLARDFYAQFFSGRPATALSGQGQAGDAHSAARWPEASRVKIEMRLPWERTFEVQVRVSW